MYRRNADRRTRLDENYPHLLLVEGVEDCRFYDKVCQIAGVADRIELRPAGGKDDFPDTIAALVPLAPHLKTIAVIRDAEEHPRQAWRSACDALERASLPRPGQPGVLSPERDGRCTAVLVVPRDRPGSIETICWASLVDAKPKHPLVTCIEEFLACARASDPPANQPTQAAQDKSRVWSLLAAGATNPRPVRAGLRLAEAAEKDFWDWSHPAFVPIIDFLKIVARL